MAVSHSCSGSGSGSVGQQRLGRRLGQLDRPVYSFACPDVEGPYHARLLQQLLEATATSGSGSGSTSGSGSGLPSARPLYAVIRCGGSGSSTQGSLSSGPGGPDRLARLLQQELAGRPLYAAEEPCCISGATGSGSGPFGSSGSGSSGSSGSRGSTATSGSSGAVVVTDCCDAVPVTLYASIIDKTGDCTCLPDTMTLNYDVGSEWSWTQDATTQCEGYVAFNLFLECVQIEPNPPGWSLQSSAEVSFVSETCDPFTLIFDAVASGVDQVCTGTFRVVITS